MSVWFVIPSKRPPAEANACLEAWRDMGYKTAVMREFIDGHTIAGEHVYVRDYRGWAGSVNALVRLLLKQDNSAQWFVTGGDDYWPDPNKRAEEIAGTCERHFIHIRDGQYIKSQYYESQATFGVMQPTGDPWSDSKGRIIERIAGSPWLGREWCRRAYGGNGPLPPYYFHNYADEELQLVAQKLGVFWQRPDIVQAHRHWGRPYEKAGMTYPVRVDVKPAWWDAQCGRDYSEARRLFMKRKAAGFPGHEPLAQVAKVE